MRYIFSETAFLLLFLRYTYIQYSWNMIKLEDIQICQNFSDIYVFCLSQIQVHALQKWTQPIIHTSIDFKTWLNKLLSFCRTLVWSNNCATKIIPISTVELSSDWLKNEQTVGCFVIGKEFCTTFCLAFTLGL